MRGKIIGAIIVGIVMAAALVALIGHASNDTVKTSVSIVDSKGTELTQVLQGEKVYIKIKVENDGDSAYPLSSHVPVFAYAKIYKIEYGNKVLVDTVKYESQFVAWQVVSLQPHSNYTTALEWTVPNNVTGTVEIDAWAGNSPVGTATIDVIKYDNEFVVIFTDDVVYTPGDTVTITITNYGMYPAHFGAGFQVISGDSRVVFDHTLRHMEVLEPGESITYTWTIPEDFESGWYYIFDYANDDYISIYIL